MKIEKNDWSLEIDLNGGRIKELKYKDNIILGMFERIDGKTGNTHICIPNFGEEGMEKYGLPFHGPFRNMEWKSKSTPNPSFDLKEGNGFISIIAENMGLRVEQEFNLENGFENRIRVENVGDVDMPVNIGIHNYWNSPQGWLGVKINGVDVGEIVKRDDYLKINKDNIISLPGGVNYKWILEGLNWARLWTGRSGKGENIMFDHNYVCIEPVAGKGDYFGSEESILRPGETKEVRQKINF